MTSPPLTTGDGVTECNAADAAAAALLMPPGYSLRGTMRVEKLDDMLDADVKVIKVRTRCRSVRSVSSSDLSR